MFTSIGACQSQSEHFWVDNNNSNKMKKIKESYTDIAIQSIYSSNRCQTVTKFHFLTRKYHVEGFIEIL